MILPEPRITAGAPEHGGRGAARAGVPAGRLCRAQTGGVAHGGREEVERGDEAGSDTLEGARRLCGLHSVLQTCRLNAIRPLAWLRLLAASPPDTPPSPFAPIPTG